MDLESFKNNDYIKTVWENGNTIIKTISYFVVEKTIDEYVEKFVNVKTFPYVNSSYNKILENSFDELPFENKKEVIGIIKKYLNEIEEIDRKSFLEKSQEELISDYCFSDSDLTGISKEELFKSIKGGHYCEMLLFHILLSLGFEKIVSKLYLQYGLVSPTGIDVPFFNKDKRILVLGECKIYKNIKSAISSCFNDLNNIYNGEKFERDFKEWEAKYTLLNETYKLFVETNDIHTKQDLIDSLEKVVCLGFVIGNEIEMTCLKDYLNSLPEFSSKSKFEVILITIPIENKDEFIEKCYKALIGLLETTNGR